MHPDYHAGGPVRVLFVCTGNICRSPTAAGVFTHLAATAGLAGQVEADSAAIMDYHVGEAPDLRSQAAARRRGIELGHMRARQVEPEDFDRHALILAMDRGHLAALARACRQGQRERLRLFLDFAPRYGLQDVPDPYYGGAQGFEQVLDQCEAAGAGLLDHIRRHLLREP